MMLFPTFKIEPYIDQGGWYFDDLKVGLLREPLTDGVPEILSVFCGEHPENFQVWFSDTNLGRPFVTIVKEGLYMGSTVYQQQPAGYQCWLCPALLRYFTKAPDEIFAWVVKK